MGIFVLNIFDGWRSAFAGNESRVLFFSYLRLFLTFLELYHTWRQHAICIPHFHFMTKIA
jgi:hypothetical protein